jgi:capsular exopolysaccharide synthesis family protein
VPQLSSAVASALADTGAQVLLVEGDLLDPRLAALLALDPAGAGLTDYLGGGATIDDVTRKHAASGVDVIVGGTPPANPADLLHSPALGQLVEDAAHRYDFVLVTAPPTTVGTDAAAVAARCDGVLLTVLRGRTTEPEVVAARTQLERVHTPVLGAVLVS